MIVRVHSGVLTVSQRERHVTITGGDPGTYHGPSAWDTARDIATIWAAAIGGYAVTYGALTFIAWCFT